MYTSPILRLILFLIDARLILSVKHTSYNSKTLSDHSPVGLSLGQHTHVAISFIPAGGSDIQTAFMESYPTIHIDS